MSATLTGAEYTFLSTTIDAVILATALTLPDLAVASVDNNGDATTSWDVATIGDAETAVGLAGADDWSFDEVNTRVVFKHVAP